MAAHEDLGIVLVKGTLIVTDCWHVLDDHSVVRMLSGLVQDSICFDHVIHDIGLGDLLGAELFLGAQVHAVIVAEMVVASNGGEFDTSVDHEVNQSRLHLSLTGLEVIATNESAMLLSKLNGTRNKGVLWGAVDEGCFLEDTSNGKDSRWGDFLVARFDSFHEVVSGVIHALDYVGVTLGIGGPLNNDLVKAMGLFEFTRQ